MRIRFYVDGLNFYYNVAKVINVKWLDLERCLHQAVEQHLLAEIQVEQIKFFTSPVFGDSSDRQAIYHNALQAHSPNIQIQLGAFRKCNKEGELTSGCKHCGRGKGDTAKVCTLEEKQTDVNLAVSMVKDAYTAREDFDVACLVSNDSDLLAPLTVKKELGQRTLLLTPFVREYSLHKNPARTLKRELLNPDADCIKHLVEDEVRQCELPSVVAAKFRIPDKWKLK